MNNQTNKTNYRPSLRLFHANPKGIGSALRLSLRTATSQYDGALFLSIAPQMTIGDARGPHPTYPKFDFENNVITIRLDAVEIAELLQVLRGETEAIRSGKAIHHNSAKASTRLSFRHLVDPVPGYRLDLFKQPHGGGDESSVSFFVTPAESLLLSELFSILLPALVFGEPLASDSSADGE